MKKFSCCVLMGTMVLAAALVGCDRESNTVVPLSALSYFSVDQVNGVEGFCTDLLAGQTIEAGTVCFEVDVNNVLHVTYATTGGWELVETHFWAGCSSTGYPMTNKGNPIPGQFPYNSGDITGATTYTVSVDLTDPDFAGCLGTIDCDNGNILFAMSHAALRKDNGDGTYQTETGWGNGSRVVQRGNWATQSTLTLFDDSCGGGNPRCYDEAGTAFAYAGDASVCFLNIAELNANRWGWTNGPLVPDTYTWDIWVGAGAANNPENCDPYLRNNGTLVGTATVTIAADGVVDVSYSIDAPYSLAETHVYVGCGELPLNNGSPTVAPGQYGNIHTFSPEYPTSDSYTINAGSCTDGYYVILHAKVMVEVACAE